MSQKPENTVCQMMNKLFGKALNFMLHMNLNKTINVFHINKNSLGLDFTNKNQLYCTRLINNSNVYKEYHNFSQLQDSVKFSENAKIYLYFVKKGLHQAIYVFSLNEDIIRQVAKDFGTTILSGSKIIEAVHDIFLIPEREIVDNSYVNTEYVNELDILYKQLPQRVAIGTDNIFKKYNIYQGVSYQLNQVFNPVTFFKKSWNGVFSLMIDFSAETIKRHLKLKKEDTVLGDKKLHLATKDLIEKEENQDIYKDFVNKVVLVNSMLFIDNIDEISALSNELKISFQENYLTSPKILPRTLINCRDTTFDLLTPSFNVAKYFISTHKKILTNLKRKRNGIADFYGQDINNAFINYGYYEENTNPHSIIIGPPGTGKSVGVCKIMSNVTGLDLINRKIKFLDNVKVKFCDVGYTAGGLFEKFREFEPDNVQILDSRIENLRFALFDIDKLSNGKADNSDVLFAVYFINTILEVSKTQALTQLEEDKLISAIEEIIETDYYLPITINEIKQLGLDSDVQLMLEKGYSYNNTISDLKEPEFNRFKKPTLAALLDKLKKTQNRHDLSESQKSVYDSLITKLNSLTSCHNFTTFSNVEFRKNFPIQYIDFDKIKEDEKLFTSSFWMLFKRWYKADKKEAMIELNKGKIPKTSYYVVEEAHNFFSIPSFRKLLEVAAREARKYHIYLIFISQKIEDVPNEIFSSIATRMLFFSPEKKAETKKSIEMKIGGEGYEMSDEIANVFLRIEQFQAFILHDNGSTGCNFMLTDEELKLFTPKEIY
ncbi:ATP-binding protein [Aliarcobacter butzleri]|uniref:ATP-binding protein n=1 Tax=Aliarcobacter butzleri TaxID=28197 RepID=UPI00126A259D|nr:ATP-binding protein [Aliarcobacter butzleri]